MKVNKKQKIHVSFYLVSLEDDLYD